MAWIERGGEPEPRDPLWLTADFSPRLVARGLLSGTQKLVSTEERYDGARGAVELAAYATALCMNRLHKGEFVGK